MNIQLPTTSRTLATVEPKHNKATFYKDELVIRVNTGKGKPYVMDLRTCTDAAQLLDWILQISCKGWCTPETLFDLHLCIEEACFEVFGKRAQGVFCPHGVNQHVTWT